jgi:hypothetical protein
MPGPAPKPPTKRRRANTPKSFGLAGPTIAPAASAQSRDLGFPDPVHELVADMWEALQTSCESRFFSAADWQRVRWKLWYANTALTGDKPINGAVWSTIQNGLGALLVSPSEKRRLGIELRAAVVDADEVAAVSLMSKYRDKLE